MNSTPNGSRNEIESALLDYHRSPGKFALIQRQPPLLFSCIREVLQLAAGRSPDGKAAPPSEPVQQAACFFVRCALLSPNADHYTLLGLQHGADAAAVKDRYRLMMRLMHPDFSSTLSVANWPADAATRVNEAYEVLSSPARRHSYDQRVNPPSPSPRPAGIEARPPGSNAAALKASAQDRRLPLRRLALAFGATGAAASLALLYAGSNDAENLVQRAAIRTAATAAAALPQQGSGAITPPATETDPPVALTITTTLSPVADMQAPLQPFVNTPAAAITPVLEIKKPPVLAPARPSPSNEKPTIVAALPAATAKSPLVPVPATFVAPAPAVTSIATEAIARLTPAPASVSASSPAPAVVQASAPVAKAAPNPGLTLTQVHPLLSTLLQQMESGRGDQVLSLLDQDARSTPAAQALLRQYNVLVNGARPVKLSNIQFKAEPREGRLLVTGHVVLQAGDAIPGSAGKQFSVQAEFVSRAGTVVMTRLAQIQD